MRILDLCSGFGGFSEAFVQAGDEVVRIDNNPLLSEVPHTSIDDIFAVRDRLVDYKERGISMREYDVLLAGIPCYEFSLAFSAPRSIAIRQGEDWKPNMNLLEATLDIIQITKPRYWVIENVAGSKKYFEPYGLELNQIHGAHFLYGKFPKFYCPPLPTKADRDKRHSPLRSNHRAKIPFDLSYALRKAIVDQKTLFDDYNIV